MPGAGDTYLIRTGGEYKHHLWVILILSPDQKRALMVNLTTMRSYSDTTVILEEGTHPFVKHKTVVNYSDAMDIGIDRLILAEANHEAHPQDGLAQDILKQMQEGLLNSPRTQPTIQQKYKAWTS